MIKVTYQQIQTNKLKRACLIQKIKCLRASQLPADYKDNHPSVQATKWTEGVIIYYRTNQGQLLPLLKEGEVVSEDCLKDALGKMRECGERLRQINKERAEIAETWNKTIEVIT